MAKKATSAAPSLEADDKAGELDQAIDDLRGVLKADKEGDGALGGDFAADFGATDDAGGFGGDFGGEIGGDFGGSTDFGNTDFGGSELGGGMDFGASSDFGSSSMPASEPGSALHANLDMIMNIPIDVQIILGESRMQVSTLMGLTEGSIISLDRKIGEPVDLIVNGRLIGRGEITVLENDDTRFGIKLLEVSPAGKK
jgi:flagellar motor switch protein FliN/FliY